MLPVLCPVPACACASVGLPVTCRRACPLYTLCLCCEKQLCDVSGGCALSAYASGFSVSYALDCMRG
jgi:hypothetical protein